MEIFQQTTHKNEMMKSTLGVTANSTMDRLNFLIKLVYETKSGCSKHYVQNQFEKNFGKKLSNRSFYRYAKRVRFFNVEYSWISFDTEHIDHVDQYVCEYLPEVFYKIHPQMVA